MEEVATVLERNNIKEKEAVTVEKGLGKKPFFLWFMLAVVLTSVNGFNAFGGFTEPPDCTLVPIPGTVIKTQLFIANTLDTYVTDTGVVPPQVGVTGVDVFLTGKCNKKRIPGSRVLMSGMRVGQATAPSDLVGLTVEKSVVDPGVEATCFDPATIPGPVVAYTVKEVDDFSNRGYYLVYYDPNLGEIFQTQDYAIETEAKIVGLYCSP
jgi:hypothetical protein